MIGLRLAVVVAGASAFSAPPLSLRPPVVRIDGGGAAAARFSGAAPRATRMDEEVESVAEERSDKGALDNAYFATEIPSDLKPATTTDAAAAAAAPPKEGGLVESLAWRGVVVILCALWASNFAVAKVVMAEPGVDSALYAVTRFSIAALALLPGAVAAVRRGAIDVETAKGAAICGGWVAFGYLGQTLGLLTTTASRSCVICSMHCVFVAVVSEWMRVSRAASQGRDKPFDTIRLAPAAVAVLGVAIVELQGAAGAPTIGDALSFAQPIGFGLGYLQLEDLMRKRPEAALPVSAMKLIIVALASSAFFELSPLLDSAAVAADGLQVLWPPRAPDFGAVFSSPLALAGVLYTGLITTALALWVESIAFKRVPATDASIILTTEPLFAAGAAAVTLGETFGASDYIGASLIIGACLLAIFIEEEEADESCDPESPEDCVPPRTFPFIE